MMGAGLSAELTSINPQRTAALRPSCGNVHGAASVTIGPDLPFTHPRSCCGAARQSGHSLQLQNLRGANSQTAPI
jgi:hypothetical protein